VVPGGGRVVYEIEGAPPYRAGPVFGGLEDSGVNVLRWTSRPIPYSKPALNSAPPRRHSFHAAAGRQPAGPSGLVAAIWCASGVALDGAGARRLYRFTTGMRMACRETRTVTKMVP